MATLSRTAARSGLGRVLRSVAALLAGLLVTTCADNPTSPNRPGFGSVRIQPAFDQYAIFAPLVLNQVRVIVVRPPIDTVKDTTRAFSVTQQQLTMAIPVAMQSTRETMQVTLQLLAGQTLLFSGTDDVEVRQGTSTASTSIPVTYAGPGNDATSIDIAPRDTTVRVGATVPMRATARDVEGVDLGFFYLGWSLVNADPGATIDAAGVLRAPNTAGTLIVRGITPTGLRDSVTVTVVPAPAGLAKSSGDNQNGSPGLRLAQPLAVLVTGAGNVPVPGVTVTFAATTGGGTVDSATATTDAQGIARSGVTLGQALGAQTFTVSSTGLTAVVFTATAQGVQPANRLLAAGREFTCELRNGAAFCWGLNGAGTLGVETSLVYLSAAVPVQGGLTFSTIAAGEYHTCALATTGQAYCWGSNEQGQLGDGTNTSRFAPALVAGGRTFVQIGSNNLHTCALTATGEAFCWGWNERGELGDGTTTDRNTPVAVAGGLRFSRIATGVRSTCGLTLDGAAYCWGENSAGELGDGTTTDRLAPTAVVGGQVFREINGSNNSFCAITTTGNGFCWGFIFNQIVSAPQAMGGGPYASVSGGGDQVCALTAAGAAFCGGDNSVGQLGNGNAPTDSPTPVAVSGGLTFSEIAAGTYHTCGITSAGTYCWGANSLGAVGDGSYDQRNTPVRSRGPATSIAVNGGNNQTALPGAAVTTPPSVIIRDAQNQPLRGIAITFAVTGGGGSVLSALDTTDANGIAQVQSWTLGSTPGANTLTATANYPGLPGNPVSFTATGGAPPVFRTWTGAVSSDWSNAGNWNGGVPGINDSAVIVATPNPPNLTTETVVGALTINSGILQINDQGLSIVRNLTINGGGMVMEDNSASVTVGGNATFNGQDTGDLLTAGELTIAGNFTQLSTNSPFSFSPNGTHITLFTTGAHTISFASPGAPSGSGFADVEFAGNGTVTLATAVWVRGTLDVLAAGQVFTSANGSRLGVELLVATAPVTFNNVPLVINQSQQTSITNQALTFQNMATNVVQLEINHPGSSSPLTLSGFVFSTTPVAPNGFYISANDNLSNANPLVINMTGATPAAGAPFIQTTGGATVNWASSGTLRTWTGALSSDWSVTDNWLGGNVPVDGDDVLIPEGPANAPLFSGAMTLRNLTIESESGNDVLTVNGDGGISITGNIDNQGRIVGTATISIGGAGVHTISGEISRLTVNGITMMSDNVTIPGNLQINSGVLNLGSDHGLSVGGDLRIINSGTLAMNSSTNMSVAGNVEFTGASTAGLLTGGNIAVGGNFTASATDGAYAPDADASVTLNGTSEQRISLGSTASYFANLSINQSGGGGVVLMTDVTVHETFGGGGTILGAHTLTVGLINAGNVTFNETRLVWNSTSADPPFSFSNFTFENYSAAPPQFTINHPGVAGNPINLDGVIFTGTPSPYYLQVNDNANDGVPLVVNLTNVDPADGTGLFEVTNGATVNWPAAPTVWAWTGAVSTDWSVAGNWNPATVPNATSNVTIDATANQPTLTADVTVNSVVVSTAGARLTLGGHALTVVGNFTTHTDGLLVSTNPADRLIVGAAASFQGGDETGLITAGELRVNGDFSQQVQTSPLSFIASGSHRTIMTNASQLQSVRFCCTANTSKFMNLDISNSMGINIQFANNGVFVADTFIVQPGAGPAPRLYMLGSPFQARRLKVNGLIVDRGTLTLNEGGVVATQQFDNVTFENYLASQTQFAVQAVGASPGPRVLTFNNLVFQTLTTGNSGRYLNASSSANALTIDLSTANVGNGPEFTTVAGGASVTWPGATVVNTWTGASSTAWTTPGNWNLGRIPVATDSVVIPNAVSNWPTLTGRHTVAAMFEDGRLTINGGTLEVTRGSASGVGINRIIQTTLATDSLIIGGNTSSPINPLLGVIVVGGDMTVGVAGSTARLILNGAGPQAVAAPSGGLMLIVNKPSGTAAVAGFNGDSVAVLSGTLSANGTFLVATGLSSLSSATVTGSGILQVGTSLNVAGAYSVATTRFKPALSTITIPALTYQNLQIEHGSAGVATAVISARTVATGNLNVSAVGTDVNLDLAGHTLVIGGNLTTGGLSQARIRMNNPLDSLLVTGSVTFASSMGVNPGNFTAGVLQVGGLFTQSNASYGGPNFQSTGTHKVILTAFSPAIAFDNPGPATNQSRLNDLTWTGGGTMEIDGVDSLVINGRFTTTSATPVTVIAPGVNRSIRFGSLAATAQVTFSQVRVIVSQPAVPSPGADMGLNNIRFFNQDPARVWLTIEHPGFTGGLSVDNVTYTTVPNNGGFYMRAVDNNPSDGLPLVVNVTNTTPSSPSGLTQVANGATISWPYVPAAAAWTGAVSTAWENPANWSVNAVPGSTTAVTIPSGTPFAPTAGAVTGTSAGNLTVAGGATLTLVNPFSLTVSGNVDAAGTIAGNGITLHMIGTAATLRGTVPQLDATGIVTLNGNTTASINGPCVFNGSAELIINGFTFSCFQLQFNNTARIQMTNPADSVVVLGSTQFSGGSTLGRLTAGVLDLRGSFQQTGTNSAASFAATGTRVRASGTGATSWAMGTGGPGQSSFSTLLVNRTGGVMTMSGPLVPVNDSMIVSSAINISVPGTINPNKLRLAAGAGLTGAGSIQIIGDSLFVATPANYTIGFTTLYGTGSGNQQIPALPYPSLTLENSATHTLTGRTATTGPVFVVNGTLVLGGRTLSTAAGFQVQPDGQVQMNNALDSLLVGGNAFFQSTLDGTGNMTAGVLRIAQNMSVDGSTTGFAPSGTHKTILASVLASNVNWTGLGSTPIQFQDLEANANNLGINYARVNGTMNVTGTGGINVSTLNVRGQLTTASTAGMGIDTLYLGAATPIAPGSGRVAANVYILDHDGFAQSMPTLPVPTAGGADSAVVIIRSQVGLTSDLLVKGLHIEGNGLLENNEQTINVFGDFSTAGNGRLFMQYALSRLNITGATTFGGGSETGALTNGILTTSGRFTQIGTNSTSSFQAIGEHTTRIATNYPGGNAVTFSDPQASAFFNLDLAVPVTWNSDVLIFNNFTNSATGAMSPQRFAVQGAFSQTGNSAFTPRKLVFYGTTINVTNGSLAPDTFQVRDNNINFVWPVGARYTWNHAILDFSATVNLGVTAPTVASLTLANSATLQLNGTNMAVNGTLNSTGTPTILGTGAANTLTARRLQVNGLTVDNARLLLNENGTAQTQQFDNVTFQNLTAPGASTPLLGVTGVGSAGRTLTFNAVNFPVISNGWYTGLTSSNGTTIDLVMAGSNQAAVGAASSNPPNETRVGGALIDWQP